MTACDEKPLMQVVDVKKYFPVSSGKTLENKMLRAVDGVSFNVKYGETFGLVGESGCGKSTLAKTILKLTKPTDGSVHFEGNNIYKMSKNEFQKVRREMQIVFQDPYDSLNPRMTLEEIIAEPFIIHKVPQGEREKRIRELFDQVGLSEKLLKRYPHQLSGGQRQRLSIARSLALYPKLVVCDEAVSALDVSIQAQILNLLLDLKDEFNLTYIFITHNISVAKFMSDKIGVMYLGRLVESAPKRELFENCLHPYTHALLSAVPNPYVSKQRVLLKGDIPSLVNPPIGCAFHERCNYRKDICKEMIPQLTEVKDNHYVACHMAGKLNLNLSIL
ncbi:ABC transporter ATP-binding protein [Tepidanaerobacter syntrophicus]|uniref:ABC transporter ATP-binding protein n=1 Tax=Tepidanaerobacter syntrophicus TaxID=224999 RepID=UPI001BD47980|nr:oligopeptide/dipeptide ABC transporter ATP-binding protein [Tepidanaerobacter syntrophicus]